MNIPKLNSGLLCFNHATKSYIGDDDNNRSGNGGLN
jgi:hypothetical protein